MADIDLHQLTVDIVSAHVANNTVSGNDLPGLIKSTYDALAGLNAPTSAAEVEPAVYEPATTVRKSLANPERIISMIDGKPYSALTRHLRTQGLTPAQYRERYGLKADYPMVAPGYSEKRRALSIQIGLGRKREPEPAPAPAKRGKAKSAKEAASTEKAHPEGSAAE